MGDLDSPRSADAERRECVMKLCVMDDIFFERYIQDADACEELIQTVLDNPKLCIKRGSLEVQKSIKLIGNRSIRVDAYVKDEADKIYNIEIQRADNYDHVRRVRYHASAITVDESNPGDKFTDVKDVIVIYISEFDIFKAGRTAYHAYTTVQETGERVNDGLELIYVNTEHPDGSKLARLMQLYKQPDFADKDFPKSSARMRTLKHDKEEVKDMCDIVRERERIAAENTINSMIISMHKNGIGNDLIADIANKSIDYVEKIINESSVVMA